MLRKSNPWSGGSCGRDKCFPCRREKGGDCSKESVCYTLWCELCGEGVAEYKGETGRNGYTSGPEHLASLEAKSEEKSLLWLHSKYHHNESPNLAYSMRVTGVYPKPLDRQVTERVEISNFKGTILMNQRNEMGGIRVKRQRHRRWGGD